MNSQLRSPLVSFLLTIFLAITCFLIILPVIYAAIGAFRSAGDIQGGVIPLLTGETIFDNFSRAWEQSKVANQLRNSIIVTICQTAGQFITSILAAYALVFGRLPYAKKILIFFLLPMMIPSEVMVIGNYLTVRQIGLYDTIVAIFLPYVASSLTLFLFVQAFQSFPKEIHEATKLEGVGVFGFLFKFLLPLNRPVCMTAIVTSVISAWNGYMWPLLITQSPDVRTIQPGIKALADAASVDTGLVLAGIFIAMVPTILVVVFGQKYLSRGLTDGAVK
ncbi:MAG: carbohydrate ABC transporter permease [Microbacteriaceae bacterium]|nr:carbohydrate ABC transporter permease [Microbacteriaceae bacterium]